MNIKTIVSLHILLFLSLLIIYTAVYDYPIPIIPISLLILFCIYSAVAWLLLISSFFISKESIKVKVLTSLLFAIITSSLVVIFILNFIGNSNWGTNVTIDFIIKYSQQITKIKETLPVPLNVIYLLLSISFGIIFYIYLRNIKHILTAIENLKHQILKKTISAKNTTYLVFSLLTIPFFLLVFYTLQSNHVDDMFDGEPLTDLFLPHTTIFLNQTKTVTYSSSIPPAILENIDDKPNIILIIADALRADHVGAYGYKRQTTQFLDSLLDKGKAIKIENAFSTCAESNCGILSTLTSRPFDEIAKNNININGVLKSLGYDVNFILSADHSWAGLGEHYPPYDVFYDGNSAKQYANTDDQLVLDRLKDVPKHEKPSFFYFHLMSNHTASRRKKQFAKYTPYSNPNDWFYRLPIIKNIFSTNEKVLEENYYDNGILSTDYYISQIFNELSIKGYMENSIVWIIADHGEALGEHHGYFGHIGSLYNEETKIPMIIVDSKPELYKERKFATQLDVAPTILDRLNINIPSTWKGKSLLKEKKGTQISHHDVPNRAGDKAILMRKDNNQIYKMLYNDDPFKIRAVFNITEDKQEIKNLNTTENQWLIDSLIKAKHQNELPNLKEIVSTKR